MYTEAALFNWPILGEESWCLDELLVSMINDVNENLKLLEGR